LGARDNEKAVDVTQPIVAVPATPGPSAVPENPVAQRQFDFQPHDKKVQERRDTFSDAEIIQLALLFAARLEQLITGPKQMKLFAPNLNDGMKINATILKKAFSEHFGKSGEFLTNRMLRVLLPEDLGTVDIN
jgi:hypothetical protein